jgi:hypothetical protein
MDKLTIVGKHDDKTIAQMQNAFVMIARQQAFYAPTAISAMPNPLAA